MPQGSLCAEQRGVAADGAALPGALQALVYVRYLHFLLSFCTTVHLGLCWMHKSVLFGTFSFPCMLLFTRTRLLC